MVARPPLLARRKDADRAVLVRARRHAGRRRPGRAGRGDPDGQRRRRALSRAHLPAAGSAGRARPDRRARHPSRGDERTAHGAVRARAGARRAGGDDAGDDRPRRLPHHAPGRVGAPRRGGLPGRPARSGRQRAGRPARVQLRGRPVAGRGRRARAGRAGGLCRQRRRPPRSRTCAALPDPQRSRDALRPRAPAGARLRSDGAALRRRRSIRPRARPRRAARRPARVAAPGPRGGAWRPRRA